MRRYKLDEHAWKLYQQKARSNRKFAHTLVAIQCAIRDLGKEPTEARFRDWAATHEFNDGKKLHSYISEMCGRRTRRKQTKAHVFKEVRDLDVIYKGGRRRG